MNLSANSLHPKDQTDGVGIVIADSLDPAQVTEIWLMQRGSEVRYHGKWENCGGTREPGEAPEAAARRELLEELKVTPVRLKRLARTFPFGPGGKADFLFIATIGEQVPVIAEVAAQKCAALHQVPLTELANYDLTPYSRKDFELLGWL